MGEKRKTELQSSSMALVNLGLAVTVDPVRDAVRVSLSMKTADAGLRGVALRFRKVIGEGLPEGPVFVNPLMTHIGEFDTRVRK